METRTRCVRQRLVLAGLLLLAAGLPGAGKTVMHLVAWRVERYADLPAPMRAYLESKARLWMQPPADIAEVRVLQAALPARRAE